MGTALAGMFAAVPVDVRFSSDGFSLTPAMAFAKDGRDDDDRGSERDDDSGRDDNGGSGRDDDGRDDDRGRGRGGDDVRQDDDSGQGRGRGRGRGRGGDDHGRDRHDSEGFEVTLQDGSRIEIEGGWFERKDASGRTVEERLATAADVAQYAGASPRPDTDRSGGGIVTKAEREGTKWEVMYSDGWKEEIEAGRYELKDALNRTVVERPATEADLERLSVAFR
ncbi:hypothetical protein [Palleronia marisminoris]|nr:hypothetical protein [Palleronia marisminoris]